MTDHKTGTRKEWLAARLELLKAEKDLTRGSDELARLARRPLGAGYSFVRALAERTQVPQLARP